MNWRNFWDQLVAKDVLETRDENSMMSEMKQMILIHPEDGSQAGIDVHNTSCITVTMESGKVELKTSMQHFE